MRRRPPKPLRLLPFTVDRRGPFAFQGTARRGRRTRDVLPSPGRFPVGRPPVPASARQRNKALPLRRRVNPTSPAYPALHPARATRPPGAVTPGPPPPRSPAAILHHASNVSCAARTPPGSAAWLPPPPRKNARDCPTLTLRFR